MYLSNYIFVYYTRVLLEDLFYLFIYLFKVKNQQVTCNYFGN